MNYPTPIPYIPTPVCNQLRETLRADARTHLGRLAAPVWTPPPQPPAKSL